MATSISLPDDVTEKANILADKLDVSLDELATIAFEELFKKYSRASDADFDFEQKMAIAQRGIEKYQQTLIELAK